MIANGQFRIVGSDSEKPCTDSTVYCSNSFPHSHDSPREALAKLCTNVSSWNQRVAGHCRSSRTNKWFGRYRDPVLHGFAEWAAERLDSLAELLEALLPDARLQNGAELDRAEKAMKAVAEDCLREITLRAMAQHQQRSGFRKARNVAGLYNSVHGLFKHYAEADEIIYLARWVCSGVRPASSNHDEAAANGEGRQGGNGN